MAQLMDWPWQVWAEHRPKQAALWVDKHSVSWQVLQQQIARLAAGFQQQGLEEHSIVALKGKHDAVLLLSYLALLQCGARVLPLNPQFPPVLLTTLLAQLQVTHILSGDQHLVGLMPSKRLILKKSRQFNELRWQPQRWATLTLTSGSTGLPKAAVHSLSAHLASAEGLLSSIPLQPTDRWLLSLPLFHVSGQGIVWRWLFAGSQLGLRGSTSLVEALSDCTHASLVPTQLWRLLRQPALPLGLKTVLLGGAMIPAELAQQAQQQGIDCWCSYGMTELAATVCVKRTNGLVGVGRPLPHCTIKLEQDEVFVRGKSLAAGYWLKGKLQPLPTKDGWFSTGDRGRMHQGELQIIGRRDNLFFRAGEGIQPEEIESMLAQFQGVSQVFIVPLADEEFGQQPVAVVEGEGVNFTQLARWLQGQVATFAQPIAWLALPNSLKNQGIKVSRQQVQHWVAQYYGR